MDHHLAPRPLRVFLESDQGEKEVDLTTVTPTEFFKNDLIRYRLTGTIPPAPDFSKVNFIACELFDIAADEIDFSECDFKDTLLKGAIFSNCSFNGGTFATTFFSETEFRHCTFYNHAAYSCDFHQVRFIDCDLTNLLVKSSRFSQCTFENCITSNKICEMSTLFDISFANTPIQVETITNNFGLTSDNLQNAPIRSGRAREPHQSLRVEDLQALLNNPNLTALERLSLEYFLDHTLVNGSPLLDESLDITRWTRIYRNPGSFVELLDKFAEFLIHLYDDNKLTTHTILLLHHITSTLINLISPEQKLYRVAMSLGGIHLILSRIVEEYLYVLDLTSQHTTGSVTFLAEGPTDPDYFRTELEPWIGKEDVMISRLERNSPLMLELTASNVASLLPLLAVFLATRIKLEITRLKTTLEKEDKPKSRKRRSKQSKSQRNLPETQQKSLERLPQVSSQSIFSVSTGLVTTPNPAYQLSAQVLLPKSYLIDLKLNFSTTIARRLRSLLLNLLMDSPSKRS
jgi:uncharacterized protein YjbI with pentapeptide repeats